MSTDTTVSGPEMTGETGEPRVQAIMCYQQQVAAGDLTAARSIFHPDVVYVVPGRSPFAGTHHGPDAVMGYFAQLLVATGFSYRISRIHGLVSGEPVALETRNHADRGGRHLDWNEVIVFRFDAQGRKTHIRAALGRSVRGRRVLPRAR